MVQSENIASVEKEEALRNEINKIQKDTNLMYLRNELTSILTDGIYF